MSDMMQAPDGGATIVPLKTSPELNRILLRNARQPLSVLGEKTGLSPEEAGERLASLLIAHDWRDDLMEEKLLLFEAGNVIEDLRERMKTASTDEDYGSMARAQLTGIKMLLDRLEKRRNAIDGDLSKINLAQAQLMFDAFKVARELAVENLKLKYPEIAEEELRSAFDEALPQAIIKVESKVE